MQLRDFVIVRELELDLAGGFTVLTGETGAGKSILLDSLGLALGRNWLELVMGGALPLTHEGWRTLTIRLIWFFVALAALNEVLRRATDPGGFMGLVLTDQACVVYALN